MTPEDRGAARRALERGLLTIEQVELVQADCASSGRSFVEAARARGFAIPAEAAIPPPPGPRRTLLFPALLGLIGLVLLAGMVTTIRRAFLDLERETGDLDEQARFRIETERRSYQARKAFADRMQAEAEAQARGSLEKARATMRSVEERLAALPSGPQPEAPLNEAARGFTAWLERHPDDVGVLLERARAFELRRFLAPALADLEKASSLRPSLSPQLAPRITAIRAQLSPKD